MSTPEKPKQLLLPGLGSLAQEYYKPKRRRIWYYLHNMRDHTMLVLTDFGEFVWVDHDTISNTPHLVAGKQLAMQLASSYNHVTVKKYRWRK